MGDILKAIGSGALEYGTPLIEGFAQSYSGYNPNAIRQMMMQQQQYEAEKQAEEDIHAALSTANMAERAALKIKDPYLKEKYTQEALRNYDTASSYGSDVGFRRSTEIMRSLNKEKKPEVLSNTGKLLRERDIAIKSGDIEKVKHYDSLLKKQEYIAATEEKKSTIKRMIEEYKQYRSSGDFEAADMVRERIKALQKQPSTTVNVYQPGSTTTDQTVPGVDIGGGQKSAFGKENIKKTQQDIVNMTDTLKSIDDAIELISPETIGPGATLSNLTQNTLDLALNFFGEELKDYDPRMTVLESIIIKLRRELATASEKGVLSNQDIKAYEQILGELGTFTNTNKIKSKLKWFKSDLAKKFNRRRKSLGGESLDLNKQSETNFESQLDREFEKLTNGENAISKEEALKMLRKKYGF